MAYPNLYSDESVIVNAQNIKVKSVSFEAVLTTRRLILVDSKKHIIAPQEILLATIRDIEVGENAIRDPTITLSIITATGATRQMILTFSKISGGERKRECDEWVKILKSTIASAVQHAIVPDTPPRPDPYAADTAAAPAASPRVEATPVPPAPAPKKKIEIARPGPMKKIVETAPTMPKPVETTSLPTGGSFCNRCGSRVPPDSAFCNKCGTPVVTEADLEARLAGTATAPAPAPVVPQVHVTTPPVYGASADKKERPIEDVIHSIEPLIEDSVPRTIPAPIVPRHYPQPQQSPEAQAAEPQPASAAPAPSATPAPAAAPDAAPEAAPADQPAPAVSEVKWPVLGGAALPPQEPAAAAGSPAAPAPAAAAPAAPVPPVPPAPAPARSKKLLVGGIVALVIIAIIAAVFVFANPLSGGGTTVAPTPTPTPTTTPLVTTAATTVPASPVATAPAKTTPVAAVTSTPAATSSSSSAGQLAVPSRGVFVHVIYAGEYKGSVGMPGSELDVTGTGEKIFTIPTVEGIVVASIQKVDGSSDKLTVEVYKNGDLVISKSTVTPKGIVEVQANLKPATTKVPATVETTSTARAANTTASATPVANATANATVTAAVS